MRYSVYDRLTDGLNREGKLKPQLNQNEQNEREVNTKVKETWLQ